MQKSEKIHITKSQVEERRAQLVAERDQHIANISAYNGAIEDCDFWLQVLEDQDKGE